MNAPKKTFTNAQYQAAIDKLGLSQMAASRFLKLGERTSRRYAGNGKIPYPVALALTLMIEKNITPKQLGFEE